ncbi:MAG TPA: DUF6101 family protein [Methylocystis sp.]|nr:DUF6101 family protein [Methylocystis sp.]
MSVRNGETLVLAQRDARAEGGVRQVRVSPRGVVILRRFLGISMRILAPVETYRGVALAVDTAPNGGLSYRLSLAHQDADLEVVLVETADSRAVAADWTYWADYLNLPRLADENFSGDGRRGVAVFERRRNATIAKRRPRSCARRKPGEPARAATVFAGEREIICYE